MQLSNLFTWFKKSWTTVFLLVFLAIIIFNPGAKSWLLEQLVSTGLFKAEIKKEGVNSGLPVNTEFSFTNTTGITANTGSLKGKVVFINFWASWCPPCRAEMPSLNDLYNKLKDEDRFVFLFINEDEDKMIAKQYLDKNSFAIPLFNRSGNVPSEIFSGTLPTTIVLNKEGRIVLQHTGMAGYNTDDFIKQLKGLL